MSWLLQPAIRRANMCSQARRSPRAGGFERGARLQRQPGYSFICLKRLGVGGLHERHPGVTERAAGYYEETVAVCLSRRHSSPCLVIVQSDTPDKNDQYEIDWPPVDDRTEQAYANKSDATRDAAYGLSIAAAEEHLGLFAVARCQEGTGADYYLVAGPQADEVSADGELNLEQPQLFRLEASGIDADTPGRLNWRAKLKITEMDEGTGTESGYAAVVGFQSRTILFRWCGGG